MHISLHIGAHCTDGDLLVKSLLKNSQVLSDEGVLVPGPSRYRGLLRDVMIKLAGGRASAEAQDVVLEQIMDGVETDRLVMSYESFLCGPPRVLEDGMLYPTAGEKALRLRNLFPDYEIEFFMAVRDPATFIPAIFEANPSLDSGEFMQKFNPEGLLWSDVIKDIREAVPDTPITVWCNEDTPLTWPEVLHEVAGVEARVQFMGGFDVLSQIMKREGMKRLRAYLAEHPPVNEIQRRRVLTAFLDKYAIDDEVEDEIDLPGWTETLVEALSESYDDDMLEIARIPGVTLITA
ncbi:MAG: hypothetical protein ACRBCL_12730 [Maritimibacter sp.]